MLKKSAKWVFRQPYSTRQNLEHGRPRPHLTYCVLFWRTRTSALHYITLVCRVLSGCLKVFAI
ncbi:hypothetical protein ACKLNO_06015 [Neisseriaceae bacterium B1]